MLKKCPARRICFVNSTRFWGGGEKWHFDAALHLAAQGHRVWCVAHPGGELLQRLAGTAVKRFPLAVANLSFLNPLKIARLAMFFRAERIQTVVFNGSSEMKIASIAAAAAGVAARVYRRGVALPVKANVLNRFLLRKTVTHFLANSRGTADALFSHGVLPRADRRVKIIYNGVDLSQFSPSPPKTAPAGGRRPVVLGTAARLDPRKGHAFLIEMAARLKTRNFPFRLLIAGDGPLLQGLGRDVERRGLGKEVSLLGFVRDPASFMNGLDVFLFPSLSEGFGFAMVEAMAAALPVVAFDATSSSEIVDHGRTGLLVPQNNAGALADAVEILAGDPVLRNRMGQAGRRRAAQMFDREKQLKRLEAYLCREVLPPKATRTPPAAPPAGRTFQPPAASAAGRRR